MPKKQYKCEVCGRWNSSGKVVCCDCVSRDILKLNENILKLNERIDKICSNSPQQNPAEEDTRKGNHTFFTSGKELLE